MVARTSKAPTSYWEHFSQPSEGGFPLYVEMVTQTHIIVLQRL